MGTPQGWEYTKDMLQEIIMVLVIFGRGLEQTYKQVEHLSGTVHGEFQPLPLHGEDGTVINIELMFLLLLTVYLSPMKCVPITRPSAISSGLSLNAPVSGSAQPDSLDGFHHRPE